MADSGTHNNETTVEIVKEGPVICGSKPMTLLLTTRGVTLREDGAKKSKGLEIPWCDVIAAQPIRKVKDNDETKGFSFHYMELQSNKKLRSKKMDISSSEEPADVWIDNIQRHCASVKNRPKRVFVVINRIGGSESGEQVYEKKVRPLFELAQIHADVQITERAKHALDIGENQDFSSYDGIIVMGGDGTYQEILQGLTIQTQKASGVDYHDNNATLKALSKPIGVIPTGTGNGMSGFANGVVDVETAALRVLRGEQHSATALSIYSDGKLFAICGLLVAYGFFSDIIKRTDELRWMKRARYPYCLLASIFGKKRGWQCDLEYRLAPDTSCGENMGTSGDGAQNLSNDKKFIKYDNKNRIYKGVSAFIANIERKDDRAYVDIYSNHFALMVDHGCSSFGLFKYLFKLMTGRETEPLPTNIEVMKRVQGFRLKLIRDSVETEESVSGARARERDLEHYVDADGELKRLDVLDFEISIIPSFVPVYGIYQAAV